MDWLRSVLLAAKLRSQTPVVPITWDEPEHSHEEPSEPAQEITCEARATGKGGTNRTKPILVVSNKVDHYIQCLNHNGRLLNSSVDNPQGRRPDIPISIREGFASSFRPRRFDYFKLGQARKVIGTRIRLQFDNVGAGVNLFVPVSVPLTVVAPNPLAANAQRALVRVPRSHACNWSQPTQKPASRHRTSQMFAQRSLDNWPN